ncbi:MAG: recombination regulator RecX [Pigmentiphaga sp.]|uniref:recombination regulator RecX n=1 Tax=Castellaniella sp. TaxID=1955812 RepID=UPI003567C212|nr:recombination regulator RecX [Pigmentiphaga sp.]
MATEPSSGPKGAPASRIKARAVGYLSRREHSRAELRRKLMAHGDDPAAIDAVLDQLTAGHWQSDARYVQGYVRTKAPRQGALRILQALRQQGVDEAELDAVRQQLQGTEHARARQVWQARFSGPAADAREYARQYRFLAGRGFGADVIRAVLAHQDPDA